MDVGVGAGEDVMLCSRNIPPIMAATIVAIAPIIAPMMALSNLKDFFGDCNCLYLTSPTSAFILLYANSSV